MKVHEKAKLYDSLIKDYEELIAEMQNHSNSIKETLAKENKLHLYYLGCI